MSSTAAAPKALTATLQTCSQRPSLAANPAWHASQPPSGLQSAQLGRVQRTQRASFKNTECWLRVPAPPAVATHAVQRRKSRGQEVQRGSEQALGGGGGLGGGGLGLGGRGLGGGGGGGLGEGGGGEGGGGLGEGGGGEGGGGLGEGGGGDGDGGGGEGGGGDGDGGGGLGLGGGG